MFLVHAIAYHFISHLIIFFATTSSHLI